MSLKYEPASHFCEAVVLRLKSVPQVIIPDFTVRKVAQDSPVVRSTNLVFVTLMTNAELEGDARSYIDVQVFFFSTLVQVLEP